MIVPLCCRCTRALTFQNVSKSKASQVSSSASSYLSQDLAAEVIRVRMSARATDQGKHFQKSLFVVIYVARSLYTDISEFQPSLDQAICMPTRFVAASALGAGHCGSCQ